jgi:hypothetical protein
VLYFSIDHHPTVTFSAEEIVHIFLKEGRLFDSVVVALPTDMPE